MNIPKIKDTVKYLLNRHPVLRDDDNRLIINVWLKEDTLILQSGFQYVANELISGGLSSPESITRARRALQKEFPELRGEKYKARMQEQERVKKDLGY